jgi:type IV pilus assembly protein PilA
MKNKGFTLTELIGVIVLLGIISLIAVPIINSTLTNSKVKAYNAQVNMLEEAGKKWGVENTKYLPVDTISCNVSIAELITLGYVEDDKIIDPRDNTEMHGTIEISYIDASKTYYYNYKETADTNLSNCIK